MGDTIIDVNDLFTERPDGYIMLLVYEDEE
jgi:hypothetical protein